MTFKVLSNPGHSIVLCVGMLCPGGSHYGTPALSTAPKPSNPSCKTLSAPESFPTTVKGFSNSPPNSPSPEKALFSLDEATIRGAGAAGVEGMWAALLLGWAGERKGKDPYVRKSSMDLPLPRQALNDPTHPRALCLHH